MQVSVLSFRLAVSLAWSRAAAIQASAGWQSTGVWFVCRLGWASQPGLAFGNVRHHTGLRGDRDLVANLEMACKSGLSRKNDIVAQLGAACDAIEERLARR